MFSVKHITETYSDPVSSVCDIGKFDGPKTAAADLVFSRDGIDSVKTFMNSNVLRELLLSNPELIAQCTGVVCVDVDEYNKIVNNLNEANKKNKVLEYDLRELKGKIRKSTGGVK